MLHDRLQSVETEGHCRDLSYALASLPSHLGSSSKALWLELLGASDIGATEAALVYRNFELCISTTAGIRLKNKNAICARIRAIPPNLASNNFNKRK